MAEAVAGSTWQREFPLNSQASSHAFQTPPTIAVGDFKRSIVTAGGTVGALTNLDNLPTIDPAGSVQVKIILSASETTNAGAGGHINIIGVDASGAEWDPIFISVDVEAATTNARASDIQSRIPAALVGGRMDANMGAISTDATAADNAESFFDGTGYAGTGNVIPTVTTVTNLTNAPTNGDLTATMKTSVTTAATAATPTVTAGTVSDKTGYSLATTPPTAAQIRTEMDSNSTQLAKLGTPAGASLAADVAAVKSDTAATLIDTAEIGTAGAGLTALASATNLATLAGYVDTEVAAIKAKTDNLPASPANEATLTTIAGYLDTEVASILAAVDTEVAAIKTVTDALPNSGALTTITNNVASILADTGTDGVVLSTAQMQALADIVLARSVSNIDNTASTHSLYELIQAFLESNTSTGSWVIYKTNGSTTFNTRTLATDDTALPIVGVS